MTQSVICENLSKSRLVRAAVLCQYAFYELISCMAEAHSFVLSNYIPLFQVFEAASSLAIIILGLTLLEESIGQMARSNYQ